MLGRRTASSTNLRNVVIGFPFAHWAEKSTIVAPCQTKLLIKIAHSRVSGRRSLPEMHRRQKFRRDLNSTGLMANSDVGYDLASTEKTKETMRNIARMVGATATAKQRPKLFRHKYPVIYFDIKLCFKIVRVNSGHDETICGGLIDGTQPCEYSSPYAAEILPFLSASPWDHRWIQKSY